MTADPAKPLQLDAVEFLAWDQTQDERHEFEDGQIIAMAGASARHNALSARILVLLATGNTGGCRPYSEGQRIAAVSRSRYYYADGTLVCGPLELDPGTDALLNPSVLIEVLSHSTEARDRGKKWRAYQRLASLTDYLMVSQWDAEVEHYWRQPGGQWAYAMHGAGSLVTLVTGQSFAVDALYDGVWSDPGDE